MAKQLYPANSMTKSQLQAEISVQHALLHSSRRNGDTKTSKEICETLAQLYARQELQEQQDKKQTNGVIV